MDGLITLGIILIPIITCICLSIWTYKSEYNNIAIIAIFVIYFVCFHEVLGSSLVGLGYYLDPLSFGDNNKVAMFLIKLGGFIM